MRTLIRDVGHRWFVAGNEHNVDGIQPDLSGHQGRTKDAASTAASGSAPATSRTKRAVTETLVFNAPYGGGARPG
jgi:hypothetical protein